MPTAHYLPDADEIPFLEAIRSHFLDDTPRLVFADFLQERNDPRCEFIRASVAQARAFAEGRQAPAGVVGTVTDLWRKYGGQWCGTLWEWRNLVHPSRGLIKISGTPEDFLSPCFTEMLGWADAIRVVGSRGGITALEKTLDRNTVCEVECAHWTQAEDDMRRRFINWLVKRTRKGKKLPSRLVSIDLGSSFRGDELPRLRDIGPAGWDQLKRVRAISYNVASGSRVENDDALGLRDFLSANLWEGELETTP